MYGGAAAATAFEESPVVDLVMGPDSYRHLPHLIRQVESGTKAIHTLLSREETYADLAPLRLAPNKVSAYLSIMRGCNNMCTFCIVPFTRGRERSRPHQSIIQEAIQLAEAGYKEITLLGQNVDSYNDNGLRFAQLLRFVAEAVPDVWIRFATSHPKDMLDEVLETIAAYPNLSPYIHLPIQSGSNRILARMNRGYTRRVVLGADRRNPALSAESSDFYGCYCWLLWRDRGGFSGDACSHAGGCV